MPGIARSAPLRLIAVALTLPGTDSRAVSAIVALTPPFSGPVTVSPRPSFSVNPLAVKPASVAIWFAEEPAPVRLVAPVELPLSVPTISVPVSAIDPPVAVSAVVPAPRRSRCRGSPERPRSGRSPSR